MVRGMAKANILDEGGGTGGRVGRNRDTELEARGEI